MNVELARKAIEVARENPEGFDMDNWVLGNYEGYTKDAQDTMPPCGTTACYAGWVSFLAAPAGTRVIESRVLVPGHIGHGVHVGDYAVDALGITAEQSQALFYLDNLEQVERAVDYLADNPDASYKTLRDEARTAR